MNDENPYAAPEADVQVDANPTGELASRGARFVGAFVDGLAMFAVMIPILLMTGFFATALEGDGSVGSGITEALAIFAFSVVVFLLINGYPLAKRGQTVGKMVAKTRIVSIKDGKILSLGSVVGLRYVPVWVISQIPLVGALFGLIDSLFVFRDDRRCIHDLIAGTRVVTA